MRLTPLVTATLGALALAGCATTPPVEVTRFHLGTPVPRGTIAVVPFTTTGPASLEYKTYAAAVETQLLKLGYTVAPDGEDAQLVASVNFLRTSRGMIDEGPPITLGLGVGSFGRHVGGGGSAGIGIGKHRRKELIVSELSVRISDRASGTALWEGRAQLDGAVGSEGADTNANATKLATALFKGFPGESGKTIKVQ